MIHTEDRCVAAAVGIFSLGSPRKQVFAGHVIYMLERTSHFLIRETGMGAGAGGGTDRAVCWASLLDSEDQGPPADGCWDILPGAWLGHS